MISSGSVPAGSLVFVVGGESGCGFSFLFSRASSKTSLMISDLVLFGSPARKSKIALSPGISVLSDRVILFLEACCKRPIYFVALKPLALTYGLRTPSLALSSRALYLGPFDQVPISDFLTICLELPFGFPGELEIAPDIRERRFLGDVKVGIRAEIGAKNIGAAAG
jgi:hypothetical protein